jgi:hypothetical protein
MFATTRRDYTDTGNCLTPSDMPETPAPGPRLLWDHIFAIKDDATSLRLESKTKFWPGSAPVGDVPISADSKLSIDIAHFVFPETDLASSPGPPAIYPSS